jgi:membrane fusion protein, heavy metal efflux system
MNRTIFALLVVGCGSHSHDDKPADEPHTDSFTVWTSTHEYFVEHPPFVVGQSSPLAAHVTQLDGHAAVKAGKLTAILTPKSGNAVQAVAAAPARPGIFRPAVIPTSAGACTLTLRLEEGSTRDEMTTECTVLAPGAKPPEPPEDPPGRISFLKETAWSTDFGTSIVEERELIPTLRTTGEIRATAGREARLTATAHGRVVIESPVPIPGTEV